MYSGCYFSYIDCTENKGFAVIVVVFLLIYYLRPIQRAPSCSSKSFRGNVFDRACFFVVYLHPFNWKTYLHFDPSNRFWKFCRKKYRDKKKENRRNHGLCSVAVHRFLFFFFLKLCSTAWMCGTSRKERKWSFVSVTLLCSEFLGDLTASLVF